MLELVIVKGGWVMAPILALSVYALAVIFYKLYQFKQLGVFSRGFVEPALQLVHRAAYPEAISLLAGQKSPLARVMRHAIELLLNRELRRTTKEAEIARVGTGELRRMETHLRGLEMAYSAAPLLGLLGTVLGMVTAFSKLAAVGSRVDPSILAGGIWEALITTVAGLIVAVPALVAYYWFDSVVERMRANMQDIATQILALEDLFLNEEKAAEEAPAMPPLLMTPPKAHYAKPAMASRSKAAMRKEPRKSAASPTQNNGVEHAMVAEVATKEEAPRMSLFSLQPQEKPAPVTGKDKEKAPVAAKAAVTMASASVEPAPAAKKETSTLHLLSPTYTKF